MAGGRAAPRQSVAFGPWALLAERAACAAARRAMGTRNGEHDT